MTDQTTLTCKYHGEETSHDLTVAEFKERFKDENPAWMIAVLAQIESQGWVALRFATYSIKKTAQ